jgi:dolichol-phosphate mannosyltransferase
MIQTNLVGTASLLDACLESGFEAFINTGTSSEYGFKDHAPTEDESLNPYSYYAVTKAAATMHCRYIAQSCDVNVQTLRLYSVYGPYEEPTRLIPNLVMRGMDGEFPPLVDPDIARDYVHVDDACDAYILAATTPSTSSDARGAIFNIGTGTQTTLRDVVAAARKIMKISREPRWGSMPNRPWDTGTWVADPRMANERLSWEPHYTFEKGLAATVAWFEANPNLQKWYRTVQVAATH